MRTYTLELSCGKCGQVTLLQGLTGEPVEDGHIFPVRCATCNYLGTIKVDADTMDRLFPQRRTA